MQDLTRFPVNGSLTEFLFDGVDPVQETSGATILANMLSGAGVDEIITRTDTGTGATSTFLTDALGSPVALANASGVVQTEYTYEPFGKANFSGSSNNNSYQYTGRENDGTGIYYYRARYYHPTLQRFISEDPIEFEGGDTNLYAYVWNNPLSYTDPSGGFPWAAFAGACAVGAATGVATEFGFGQMSGRKPTPSEVGSAAVSGCAGGMAGLGLGKAFSAIKAAIAEKGLTTPSKYFANKTAQQVSEAMTNKYGPPRSVRPGAETYYNPTTKRSYNVHTDPKHGSPHIDIRRRGGYPERKYSIGE